MKKNNLKYLNDFWRKSSLQRHFRGPPRWQPLNKRHATTALLCFFVLFVFALVLVGWIDAKLIQLSTIVKKQAFPLNCFDGNITQSCSGDYPTSYKPKIIPGHSYNQSCPEFFRWIHEDLKPWKESGITREMVEAAKWHAHFRLTIVDGKAYVEKFRKSLQTRDLYTLWGFTQLLRRYPGRLPDLELMFDCNDRPVFRHRDFKGPNATRPPLFRYCGDDHTFDLVFPDWSFWGWVETNIKPWRDVISDIKEGNQKIKWNDRVPFAYWRGNPHVSPVRADLMRCNITEKQNYSTLLYVQDWDKESKMGYQHSNLEDQCTHRYKIYVEGWAWSVSQKYILACDSPTLLIIPHYYDFYLRGMVPLEHYWPIRDNNKCKGLQFAVEWGNNNTEKAQAIGRAGSSFIHEELNLDNVYDYMFHLMNEYAKLLNFKPTIPPGAVELCAESMACAADDIYKKHMVDSMVMSPVNANPCTLPPPYTPEAFKAFIDKQANAARQVAMWEDAYWADRKQQ
ncbi:Glycosyl transferase CAP10 domain [Dillenia turbinata]|uniref:Glycosyl transferase CAP10 domain n=1 Tax=Dillenia turbinata TaxID=194707 RepID=A0AAN8V045_9MAGN